MGLAPRPGDVVVVTGGTAGAGRATARRFARAGYRVAVIARGEDRLADTLGEIQGAGRAGLALSVDVADAEAVDRAAEQIERELGPIEVWVNDAMTTVFAPFVAIEPSEFRRATEVTYLGTVYGTLAALRRMRPRDRGTIVQVGSALAYRSIPLQSAYCGAKHAIRGFTDSIRSELLHDGSRVRITAVHLMAMNTPQFSWCRNKMPQHPQPVPPIYPPERGAEAIFQAALRAPRERVVTARSKAILWLDWIAPGYLDRYLGRKGYAAQQTTVADPAGPQDNLFAPAPGHRAAHGVFDDRTVGARPGAVERGPARRPAGTGAG
jgi:NAD(P)-dependent dehydrogenase (short-subunit alcohol dehydrogenase family)